MKAITVGRRKRTHEIKLTPLLSVLCVLFSPFTINAWKNKA